MNSAEKTDALVNAIAHEAVALIDANVTRAPKADVTPQPLAGAALARLARLLDLQLGTPQSDDELFALCARAAMETWLTGHAALLLGERGAQLLAERAAHGQPSLDHLARLLDDEMYGESERPKAFRRHLRSFFDEVDITGCEGTTVWLVRYLDDAAVPRLRNSPLPTSRPADFVRVGLWVTLFLAHGYFDAIGDEPTAKGARALFDRFRLATDDFYLRRRADTMRSESAASPPA